MSSNRKKVSNRSSTDYVLFGAPKNFSGTVLPTIEDVHWQYRAVQLNLKEHLKGKDPPAARVVEEVVVKLIDCWNRASIPTTEKKNVIKMVLRHHLGYQKLRKDLHRQSSVLTQKKLCSFKSKGQRLSDIASCKCVDMSRCIGTHIRIPVLERPFLEDQRGNRRMIIGSLDVKTTKTLQRRSKRKATQEKRVSEAAAKQVEHSRTGEKNHSATDVEADGASDSDCSFIPGPQPGASGQNRRPLTALSTLCDRFGVSSYVGAALANATLEDYGVLSSNSSHPGQDSIGPAKVWRQRNKVRTKLEEVHRNEHRSVSGLYFDGRKDKTLTLDDEGRGSYRKETKEEHMSRVK